MIFLKQIEPLKTLRSTEVTDFKKFSVMAVVFLKPGPISGTPRRWRGADARVAPPSWRLRSASCRMPAERCQAVFLLSAAARPPMVCPCGQDAIPPRWADLCKWVDEVGKIMDEANKEARHSCRVFANGWARLEWLPSVHRADGQAGSGQNPPPPPVFRAGGIRKVRQFPRRSRTKTSS
jgi:hypothetical protein